MYASCHKKNLVLTVFRDFTLLVIVKYTKYTVYQYIPKITIC